MNNNRKSTKSFLDNPAVVVSSYRSHRAETLEKFAEQLGTYAATIMRIEKGERGIGDELLKTWWNDEREWVRTMARDILIAKFAGIREALQAEAEIGNGRDAA